MKSAFQIQNIVVFLVAFLIASVTFGQAEQAKSVKVEKAVKITKGLENSCSSSEMTAHKKECKIDKAECEAYKSGKIKKISSANCSGKDCETKGIKTGSAQTDKEVNIIKTFHKKGNCDKASCDSEAETKS